MKLKYTLGDAVIHVTARSTNAFRGSCQRSVWRFTYSANKAVFLNSIWTIIVTNNVPAT